MDSCIAKNKTLAEWKAALPLLEKVIACQEVLWINPKYQFFADAHQRISFIEADIVEAEERLLRFAPYIAKAFPETAQMNGIIESPLIKIPMMQHGMEKMFHQETKGELLLKCDSHLAVSGSVKARGGIYEVLKHAEDLALKQGMLSKNSDYTVLDNDKFKRFFAQYTIVVGSTGNLGLSIGIMGSKLGFNVIVHMSADAKQWKKELLRSKGVTVVEHISDYSAAVAQGRKQASLDANSYFIDDENSSTLFLGYATAALRLKKQLEDMKISIDHEHPLFVYLPCGVGGAPGGIAFGLKQIFKDSVHCFFAEPTHASCMLVGLMTGEHDKISVHDFGMDGITEADGLAVSRPSAFIGKTLENLLSGIYTIKDNNLYSLLALLADTQGIYLEPSALAGLSGCIQLFQSEIGQKYLQQHELNEKMHNSFHIAWATGGNMVPRVEMDSFYSKGAALLSLLQQ